RVPGLVVEGDAQAATTAVAGLALELAIELGPALEALEREPPLRGVAPHGTHTCCAGARGSSTDTRAFEHGDGCARIKTAQVEGRAQAHEPSAHDCHGAHVSPSPRPSPSLRERGTHFEPSRSSRAGRRGLRW